MSKDKDEVVTAVRALLDGLEADWAARLQEAGTKPESTDYLVIEAIGIGRTQIVVAVRQFLDDLQAMNPLHNPEASSAFGAKYTSKMPQASGDGDVRKS